MTKRAVNQTCRQATGLRVQTLSSRVADYASNSAVERKKLIDDAVLKNFNLKKKTLVLF